MSDDLYRWRLRWDGRRGLAKSPAVGEMRLVRPPDLGFTYNRIDYSPGSVAQIQRQPWDREDDDMTADEVARVKEWLRTLTVDPPDLPPDS